MRIERLRAGEGQRWRSLRLQALAEAPYAFGTTYDEAVQWNAARWETQVIDFPTFVAVVEGRDVGVARGSASRRSDVRELISLWVSPTVRRQGIGAQLIDSVAAWAKGAGAEALVIDVLDTNGAAIALYERNGFLRLDREATGEGAPNELRLVRSLVT